MLSISANAEKPSQKQESLPSGIQLKQQQTPFIGAQVFVKPCQTDEEIDNWFRVLKENHFSQVKILYGRVLNNEPSGGA